MKPESSAIALDVAAVNDALGSFRLAESELQAFLIALRKRHASVVRPRADAFLPSLPRAVDSVPWYPRAFTVNDGERPSQSLAFAAGEFYLQDAGSLLALAAAEADTDELHGKLICDLCASPGGKATALVEGIGSTGFVLANEPIQGRLPALIYNLSRTGSDRWAVSRSDPSDLAQRLHQVFDMVVVDAPCSGQALLARGKQSDAALSAKQIEHSAQRQSRILDSAMRLLKPGGRLIYSTCTFAELENETQVRRLTAEQGAIADPCDRLNAYQSPNMPSSYRLWPHLDRCAGSFAARLRKDEDHSLSADRAETPPRRLRKRQRDGGQPSLTLEQWHAWFQADMPTHRVLEKSASVIAWPEDVPSWVESVAVSGPEIAHRTGRTWRPSHASAIRRGNLPPQRVLSVSDEVARQFLSGQPIECQQSGWAVVYWNDRPLGWVKGNGTIGKNHLPSPARQSWSV